MNQGDRDATKAGESYGGGETWPPPPLGQELQGPSDPRRKPRFALGLCLACSLPILVLTIYDYIGTHQPHMCPIFEWPAIPGVTLEVGVPAWCIGKLIDKALVYFFPHKFG